jgi:hypothetical protein
MARFYQAALISCVVATLALFAATAGAMIGFPYGLNYGEGTMIDQARRMAAGEPLYRATFEDPPYVVSNYPPLYVLAVAGVTRLTSLPLLPAGRAISLAGALAAASCVGLLAARLSGSRMAGLLAAALFMGNPFAMKWSALARVDFLALALSLLGLWLLLVRWRSWPWLAVIAVLVTAAIFTRQSYALTLPLTGTIWLWHSDRRRAVAFVLTVGCAGLLLFGLLNWLTAGGFYLNVVVANVHRFELSRFVSMAGLLLLVWPIALAMAVLEMAYAVRRPRQGSLGGDAGGDVGPFLRWALLPYALAAVLSALTAGKAGSDVNYLLELMAAVAMWAAIGFAAQPSRRGAIGRGSLTFLLLCQLLWTLFLGRSVLSWLIQEWRNMAEYRDLAAQVQRAAVSGPVLADEHMELVVQAGQRLYLEPLEFEMLHKVGRWDPSRLVAEVQARKFPMIILSTGQAEFAERWAPEVLEAIRTNYSATEPLPGLAVYTPLVAAP